MLEMAKEFNWGEWTTFVIVATILWRFVFKSLVDSWFSHKLELQKQEVHNALQLQKDLALKAAEFEKIKLERVLPLLEKVTSALSGYNMILNSYIHLILNNCGAAEDLDKRRLELDKELCETISAISIYLPTEFRLLLYRLRKVISCHLQDPIVVARVLKSLGGRARRSVPDMTLELYGDLMRCYYSMGSKYLGLSGSTMSYGAILKESELCADIETLKTDPEHQLAWIFLLLHEYYGSSSIVHAQSEVEGLHTM